MSPSYLQVYSPHLVHNRSRWSLAWLRCKYALRLILSIVVALVEVVVFNFILPFRLFSVSLDRSNDIILLPLGTPLSAWWNRKRTSMRGRRFFRSDCCYSGLITTSTESLVPENYRGSFSFWIVVIHHVALCQFVPEVTFPIFELTSHSKHHLSV
jgi:hypothetical protein